MTARVSNLVLQDGIKAIETIYNGYRFRSRLEARWAVFFDAAGIKYEYEPEGYDLGEAGWYLPDFYLPEVRCEECTKTGVFIEIKPDFRNIGGYKYQLLSKMHEGTPTCVLSGIPETYGTGAAGKNRATQGSVYGWSPRAQLFWSGHWFAFAPWLNNEIGLLGNDIKDEARSSLIFNKDNGDFLRRAVIASRQARFEHGETPKFAKVR